MPAPAEKEAAPRPQTLELEPAQKAAENILADAEPLRSDSDYRRQFYEVMGVQQVELCRVPDLGGHTANLWDETIQPSGSYKSRGASNGALRANPNHKLRTYSTGNHGTSVAIAGMRRGQEVIVDVPEDVVPAKEARLESAGAKVNKKNPYTNEPHTTFKQAQVSAELASLEDGVTLLPPFGHPDVLAGQCSAGFEMVEEIIAKGLADKKVVIPVPVAGGGYINGIAVAIWDAKRTGRLGPDVHVVAVQPEGTDAMNRALQKMNDNEEPVNLFGPEGPDKECDALAITEESLSPLTMAVVADPEFVEGFYTLDKASIGRAMAELKRLRGGQPVEPAAALAYAFAMNFAEEFPASEDVEQINFILPVTGGNVSPATEQSYAEHMKEANRKEFEALSQTYLDREIYGLEEKLQALGRAAVPNALSGLFDRSQSTNLPNYSPTKYKLAADAGVDLMQVQRTHRQLLAQMGIE